MEENAPMSNDMKKVSQILFFCFECALIWMVYYVSDMVSWYWVVVFFIVAQSAIAMGYMRTFGKKRFLQTIGYQGHNGGENITIVKELPLDAQEIEKIHSGFLLNTVLGIIFLSCGIAMLIHSPYPIVWITLLALSCIFIYFMLHSLHKIRQIAVDSSLPVIEKIKMFRRIIICLMCLTVLVLYSQLKHIFATQENGVNYGNMIAIIVSFFFLVPLYFYLRYTKPNIDGIAG